MGVPVTGFVVLGVVLFVLLAVAIRDRLQKAHTVVSNFPLVGRFRYWFEELGGPLRQYIVTGNDEERPFSRDQRRWVYASAKKAEHLLRLRLRQRPGAADGATSSSSTSAFPLASPAPGEAGYDPMHCPCPAQGPRRRPRAPARVPPGELGRQRLGDELRRAQRRPPSRRSTAAPRSPGACRTPARAGISDHHRHGGDLVLQIGTGYFGCRDDEGPLLACRALPRDGSRSAQVRAIEIKLSPGRQARRRRRRCPPRR